MKKFLAVFSSAVLVVVLAVSCSTQSISSQEPQQPSHVQSATQQTQRIDMNIASLKGVTTMGIVKLMQDSKDGNAKHDYNFEMYGTADEITPKLIKGDIDIALLPCNLASILFNKTEGEISVAAINTLGVLYVVTSSDQINSIEDLKGKTIYSTGKGTTPEYVLNYILQKNGIDITTDLTIEYKSEASEVLSSMMISSAYPIGVLPQPYATTAINDTNFKIALDLTKEWQKVSPESSLVTGVIVARKEFIENNKEAFEEFLADCEQSSEFVNNNIDEAAALVVEHGIVPKVEIAKKAIPFCNITFIKGNDMKKNISGYLQALFEQNPKAVGGNMPDDAFYYGA